MSDFDENTQWACPACTLHNKIEDDKCSVCGGPRPQDATDKLAAKTKKEKEEKRKFQPKIAKPQGKEEESNSGVKRVKVSSGDQILLLDEQTNAGDVRHAAFSNDGKYLAFSTKVPDVRVYCARSLKLIKTLDGQHTQNTPCLAWSPCSKFLLSGYGNGSKHQSRVYSVDLAWKDLPTTESENHMTSHNKPCTCGAFHPTLCSKKKLVFATGGYDHTVFSVEYNLEEERVEKFLFKVNFDGEVSSLAYVPKSSGSSDREYTLVVATRHQGSFCFLNCLTGGQECEKIRFDNIPWRIAALHNSPYFLVAASGPSTSYIYKIGVEKRKEGTEQNNSKKNDIAVTRETFTLPEGASSSYGSSSLSVSVSHNDVFCFFSNGGKLLQLDLRHLLRPRPSDGDASVLVSAINREAVTVFELESRATFWACGSDPRGSRVACGFDGGRYTVLQLSDKFEDRRGVILVREKGNEDIKIVKVMREIYVVWFLVSKFL